jgi:hypothetical protein
MSRLAAAVGIMAQRLKATDGVTVTYTRGSQSAPLTAWAGSFLLKVSDPSGGMRVVRTDRDYLFVAAELKLGGVITTPQRGDSITEVGADGVTRVYDVLPYGKDEPMYRYGDSARTILRVHTKAHTGGA